MRAFSQRIVALLLISIAAAGCARKQDGAIPLATPSVTLARADVAVSSPLEMTYRFVVAPGATFKEDELVFVHFVDSDRELMWTDDHQPPVPTSQWKPGTTVEYSRTLFIPKFPYTGETHVEIGLVSPTTGERVPMEGDNQGQRAYKVSTFNLRPQTDNLFIVFKDGWQDTEVAEASGLEWQWSRKDGVLSFRNPMRDAIFYLQVDQPVAAVGAQHVDVRVGSTIVDSFDLPPGKTELRKVSIGKELFGGGDSSDITISVPNTFVPASLPALKSGDARELGVRVFHAYLQAK